jgi:hypothetical protein
MYSFVVSLLTFYLLAIKFFFCHSESGQLESSSHGVIPPSNVDIQWLFFCYLLGCNGPFLVCVPAVEFGGVGACEIPFGFLCGSA